MAFKFALGLDNVWGQSLDWSECGGKGAKSNRDKSNLIVKIGCMGKEHESVRRDESVS